MDDQIKLNAESVPKKLFYECKRSGEDKNTILEKNSCEKLRSKS